jgi:hypothetical protein
LLTIGDAIYFYNNGDWRYNFPELSIPAFHSYQLKSVVWTGSQFVIVGYNMDNLNSGGILTSPDGKTWTPRNSGNTELTSLYSVTWTGTQLVAMGILNGSSIRAAVLTSPDGINWTSRSLGTAIRLFSVTWTGSQLVAVGAAGAVLTSPDGVTWTAKSSGVPTKLNYVTWTGTQLIAVGDTGRILTSPQDPVAIVPRLIHKNSLPLRLTPSQLFVALPNSLLGSNTHAAIYSISGDKMVEVHTNGSAAEISMPLNNLTRGVYLFELQGQGSRITQTFSLVR